MAQENFCVRGDICYTKDSRTLLTYENSYLVCADGRVEGIYSELPERFNGIRIYDYTNQLIIPGITDLHMHAPQYVFRGLGMDMELIEWLNTITFPQEAKYADTAYAEEAYAIFTDDLKKSFTTRACIFSTLHVPGTKILMRLIDEAGIGAYVGKVNMDRNSSEALIETTEESIRNTRSWIEETKDLYRLVKPIITPRFIPSCTDELMKALGELSRETRVPVQSHLSENLSEIAWVRELCPNTKGYADAYDSFGMLGGECRTIMAHCVHMSEEELELLLRRGVYVAHSPQSNTNLRSGVAPVREFLKRGIKTGLASDVSGGAHIDMFRIITDAIQASKLRWRLQDNELEALSAVEAFYLATAGGGEFFGKVGRFEQGYEFDAVVIDDMSVRTPMKLTLEQRLERAFYTYEGRTPTAKFVAGRKII